jgi:hypothetical protein
MAHNEGTMVIRAWLEPAQGGAFRARLISSRSGSPRESVETAGDTDQVVLAVRRWLEALQSQDATSSESAPASP